jgi:hypothetical protein
MPILLKPRKSIRLAGIFLALLTHLTACDQKRHIYTASTNGVYHAPTEKRLDTFTVDAQASTNTADSLKVVVFISRDQQVPFTDAIIDVRCDEFAVFGDGKLLTAAKLDCLPTTTVGAHMRVDATFAIGGNRPKNLRIKVPTLNLSVSAPTKYTSALRGFDVALELREVTQTFSVR